ncbi:IMV protein [Western grey kangaroopox virus]|uniref:IMV protein n=1 Tax=Western grey kangaroopox virus TaxID=1566307 RepID=A0A2C9DST6_9POXV|nr:IMV protein [Western grey kangaroopox virus]ATI21069.1 IMV protein [Western grey kangaroopox virus]
MADIDEANIGHLLSKLTEEGDTEFAATVALIKELINSINARILTLNKKSKKNARSTESMHARSGDRAP